MSELIARQVAPGVVPSRGADGLPRAHVAPVVEGKEVSHGDSQIERDNALAGECSLTLEG